MSSLAVVPSSPGVHPKLPVLLNRINREAGLLRQLDQYFTGRQPLSFLAPEIARQVNARLRSVVINWPRLIINSLEERLDVEGFRLSEGQPANKDLWKIWKANRLDIGSQMAHLDALVHGRSYAIVWADPNNPEIPKITVESAEQMTVEFEPGTTNVVAAAKHWAQDDMVYATLYLEDSIERYQAPAAGPLQASMLALAGSWELREEPIPHDLGVVPVVPFLNQPRLTHLYGESELTDVIPLADSVNKLATDLMTTSEFHAGPRRWATGLDLGEGEGADERAAELIKQRWTNAGADRLWAVDDPNVRFGQFQEANLENFVKAIEMFAGFIAAITALPPHYVGLMSQANPASADAIRSAEASLVKRAERKQTSFGDGWERVMRLALLVRDGSVPDSVATMETVWKSAETPTVAQKVDAAVKLDGIGVPLRSNLEDLGKSPTQIDRIFSERNADAVANVEVLFDAATGLVKKYGFSRAAALSAVGLQEAAKVEAIVEARAPGPGVTNDAELAAEVAAATPVVAAVPGEVPVPSKAADKADPAPAP